MMPGAACPLDTLGCEAIDLAVFASSRLSQWRS
jgi:hypothetical protein